MNQAPKYPITLNFARVNYRIISRIRLGLIIAAAVLSLAAVALILQARSVRFHATETERGLRELSASLEKMKPAIEERQRLVKNLSSMSALLEARKFSWVRLLTGLEQAFPAGVALDTLEIDPRDGILSLEGTAQSPEALSRLMIGLQRSPSFRSPKLKRQSLDKGNLRFHVDVIYQNIPAAAGTERADR